MSGVNPIGLSQMKSKTENNRRTEEMLQEQPALETDRQGCEEILKATDVAAGGEHFEHSQ